MRIRFKSCQRKVARISIALSFSIVIVFISADTESQTLGSEITYQGQLLLSGSPANGDYDFQFNLYDNSDPLLGSLLGTETHLNLPVSDGRFTVQLDFGPVFEGDAAWLEIRVRPSGTTSLTTLSPLQQITAAPYALYTPQAANAETATSAVDSDLFDGLDSAAFLKTAGGTVGGALDVTGDLSTGNLCLSGDCRSIWPGGGPWIESGYDIYSSNSGNVGIGQVTPAEKLHVGGNIRLNSGAHIDFGGTATQISESGGSLNLDSVSRIKLDAGSDVEIAAVDDVFINPDDDVRMQPGGAVRIEAELSVAEDNPPDNPDWTLHVVGTAGKTEGGSTWATPSDARFKTIQGTIDNGLEKVMSLRPVTFLWNSEWRRRFGGDDDDLNYGFVAQELESVIPEMINRDENGYLWYNPSGMEAVLVAAIREQQNQIERCRKEISELRSQLGLTPQ